MNQQGGGVAIVIAIIQNIHKIIIAGILFIVFWCIMYGSESPRVKELINLSLGYLRGYSVDELSPWQPVARGLAQTQTPSLIPVGNFGGAQPVVPPGTTITHNTQNNYYYGGNAMEREASSPSRQIQQPVQSMDGIQDLGRYILWEHHDGRTKLVPVK